MLIVVTLVATVLLAAVLLATTKVVAHYRSPAPPKTSGLHARRLNG